MVRTILLAALLAVAAWSQTSPQPRQEKTYTFAHVTESRDLHELTLAIRSTADITAEQVDATQHTIRVTGSPVQLAVADWLAGELDRTGPSLGVRDFSFPYASLSLHQVARPSLLPSPIIRVIYLNRLSTPIEIQETLNAIRALFDTQNCYPLNLQKAIVMRAAASQLEGAAWLLGQVDRPAGAMPGPISADHRMPDVDMNTISGLAVRLFRLKSMKDRLEIQELVSAIRSMSDVSRAFSLNYANDVVLRGTDEQVDLASWIVDQLDRPTGKGVNEIVLPGGQIVQIAYVTTEPDQLQTVANSIRTAAQMALVFPVTSRSAIVMRGDREQLTKAAGILAGH